MARRILLCLTTSILACSNAAAPDAEEKLSPRPESVLDVPVPNAPPPPGLSATTTRGDEVYGRVIGDDHLPVAGASVLVGEQWMMTDAKGAFVAHAQGTYDVGLVSAVGGRVSYWIGLTRKDPILVLHGVTSAEPRKSATISPTAKLAFDGVVQLQEPAVLDKAIYDGNTLRLEWSGPETAKATLWAFDAQDGSRRHYQRVARTDMTVAPGGGMTWPVAWQPVTERTVTPQVTVPDGWVVTRARLHARSDGARRMLEEESGLDALSAFAVPDIDGLSFDFAVDAMVAGAQMSIVTKPFVSSETPEPVVFGDPIVAVAPMDGASASEENRLVWSDGSKSVHTVEVTSVGSGPSYVVVTGGSSLPLSALNRIAPLGSSYAWKVSASNAYDSTDDLAADHGPAARTLVSSSTPLRTLTMTLR